MKNNVLLERGRVADGVLPSTGNPLDHPAQLRSDERLPARARRFVTITAFLGGLVLSMALLNWESADLLKFAGFLMVAIFSSGVRINVPGVTGPLSANFLFVLLGVMELTSSETVLLASLVTAIQCYWQPIEKPHLGQAVFNVACKALSAAAAGEVYNWPWMVANHIDPAVRLAAATCTLFLLETMPVAMVISLAEGEEFIQVWRECHFLSLPYYLGGGAIAQIASIANRFLGWQTVLLTGPVVYLIYRSYRLYLNRLESEKQHAEEVSSLHLRTIEALALAIEAKDHTTRDHLQRVQVYAMELAKELGLSPEDKEALRAAALLHDIGKLAVPEHIISKPGRLTPEEFEKMKIHPLVGAEILERVQFPYPVVPIVRAHHEKWNGTGYPFGLAGEAIPIGARILSSVDCLDALATDRQYRRALPLDEAMKVVISESGKAFDPRVVDVLSRRYIELEKIAKKEAAASDKLSTDLKIANGPAPAAGFEAAAPTAPVTSAREASMDFLTTIAAAREEVQTLFEISQDLGNSLSLDETLTVLAVRLRRIIPHHSLVIWVKRDQVLKPEYVTGEDFRLFSGLEIPVGHGLSGWVAENRKAILNGNPTVEPGYLNDSAKFSTLRSAVAVPLEGVNGVMGVLTLYHSERDAFTKDHVRILLAINSKIAVSIENALRFRQAESSATTDYLTTLPNARSLFLQLDAELSRGRRTGLPLAVMVLDLDGFKQVNDRFGHLEGNKVLRAVALGLRGACREYDYVARMGGDEFVVLLPGLVREDAARRVEEFRKVVSDVCRDLLSSEILTVSVGVAHFPVDAADAEQLLSEADRDMYKDKRARKQPRGGAEEPLFSADWSGMVQ